MVFCVVNTSIFFFPFYLLCLFFLLLHNGESIGSQFCSFGTDGIGNIGTNLSHSVILRNLLLQQFHFQNRHIYYSNSTIVHSFPKCIYLYSFFEVLPNLFDTIPPLYSYQLRDYPILYMSCCLSHFLPYLLVCHKSIIEN